MDELSFPGSSQAKSKYLVPWSIAVDGDFTFIKFNAALPYICFKTMLY